MSDPCLTVDVPLGSRSYPILIGRGLLSQAVELMQQNVTLQHAVIVTDTNVATHYAASFCDLLDRQGVAHTLLTVPAGESTKSVTHASELWRRMLAAQTHRSSTVMALGGGMVGDLAGFVAATYARGIDFIQFPTTLLAQVDSSVGGKTAINLHGAKNMVGCFWQPRLVVADLDTLTTLPRREFVSGLAEVLKYGVIADADLFYRVESLAPALNQRHAALDELVARCCQIKAHIVSRDELEVTGERAALNYGHTIGHALEAVGGLGQLLHGEAISMGMHCAATLAAARGLIEVAFVSRQQAALTALGLPTQIPLVDKDEIWRLLSHDKKADRACVRFVLPTAIGRVCLAADVRQEEVAAVLDACRA